MVNKYNNPRLLNTVLTGPGMQHPRNPHVVIGSDTKGYILGDLMDANAIMETIDQKINLDNILDAEHIQQAVDSILDGVNSDFDTLKEIDAKLSTIELGAEVNVQSDWEQSNSNSDDYIKNKPDINTGEIAPEEGASERLATYITQNEDEQEFTIYRGEIGHGAKSEFSVHTSYDDSISDPNDRPKENGWASGWHSELSTACETTIILSKYLEISDLEGNCVVLLSLDGEGAIDPEYAGLYLFLISNASFGKVTTDDNTGDPVYLTSDLDYDIVEGIKRGADIALSINVQGNTLRIGVD